MRVQLLSTDGAQYLAFAKQRMQTLSDLRVSLNVPALERTLWIGAVTIYLRATELENLVRISGGGSLPHILLFNGTEVWSFDWTTGKLTKQLALTSAGNLDEGWGQGRCALSETGLLTAKKTGVTASRQAMGDVSQHVTRSDALVSIIDSGFEVTTKDGTRALLGAVPSYTVDSLTQMSNSLVADLIDAAPAWNNTKTHSAVLVPLNNPTEANFVHRWVPRVFYPELGNPITMPPALGLFYGRMIPLGDEGLILTFRPAEKIVVYFGGYFDDRYRDDINEVSNISVGYCETVESMTHARDDAGEVTSETLVIYRTCFFMAELWTPPNSTFYSRPNGPGYKTVQTTHQSSIVKERFTVDYKNDLGSAPYVHWWSGEALPYPAEVSPVDRYPMLGILARDDQAQWVLHRYRGAVTKVAGGTGYLSHSVSTNGDTVAVFTGEGTFARVLVYDLKNNKVVIDKSLAAQNFTSGVIIPVKPLNTPSAVVLPESAAPFTGVDDLDYVSALGGINMPKLVRSAPSFAWGWKTTISGRRAYSAKWEDKCWERTQVGVVRPTIVSKDELVNAAFSFSIDGKNFDGVGWGGYEIPKLLWQVTGPEDGVNNEIGVANWTGESDVADADAVSVAGGTNTEAEVYKRAEDILVLLTEWLGSSSKQVIPSDDAVSPWVFTYESDHPPAPEQVQQPFIYTEDDNNLLVNGWYFGCWDELLRVQMTDSCGRIGTKEFSPFQQYEKLRILGTIPALGGGLQVGTSPAREPVTYAVTAGDGTITKTGVFTYGVCGARNVIQVLDACGDSDTLVLEHPEVLPLSLELTSGPPEDGCYLAIKAGDIATISGGVAPYRSGDSATGEPYFSISGNEATVRSVPAGMSNPCTGTSGFVLPIFDACGEVADIWQCPAPNGGFVVTGPTTKTVDGVYTVVIDQELLNLNPVAVWRLTTDGVDCGSIIGNGLSATTSGFNGCGCGATVSVEVAIPGAVCGSGGIVLGDTAPALSGPLTGVVVGSQFTVSGGTAPYTWTVSKGSIDSTGLITAISCTTGAAASAIVTVTDACGQSDSETVLYAGGQWVQRSSRFNGTVSDCHTCSGGVTGQTKWGYKVIGNKRYSTEYSAMANNAENVANYSPCLTLPFNCGAAAPAGFEPTSAGFGAYELDGITRVEVCGLYLPENLGVESFGENCGDFGGLVLTVTYQLVDEWVCL